MSEPAERSLVSQVPDSQKVPEAKLKKRKTISEIKAKREAIQAGQKKKKKTHVRQVQFKRAEMFVKEHRNVQKADTRARRQKNNPRDFHLDKMPDILLVIRVRGLTKVDPKTRKIMQLLRLREINHATFVRVSQKTMEMLQFIEPYITYGKPSLKTINDLIYKRGYGKINKRRVALSDNKIIEEALGEEGVICIEDVVHQVQTCGEHFKEVNQFLWPFKLSTPLGGWKDKMTHFKKGGSAGDRDAAINALVEKMC